MDKPKGFRCQAFGAEFDTREQLEEHGHKDKKESKPGAAERVEPPRRGGAE